MQTSLSFFLKKKDNLGANNLKNQTISNYKFPDLNPEFIAGKHIYSSTEIKPPKINSSARVIMWACMKTK